jgi:hypothetical protein
VAIGSIVPGSVPCSGWGNGVWTAGSGGAGSAGAAAGGRWIAVG